MKKKILIIITKGSEDGGVLATIGFVLALNCLTFNHEVCVFLTGDGAGWGYEETVKQIKAKFFPEMSILIKDILAKEGKIILCSTCSKTCPVSQTQIKGVDLGGVASIIPFIVGGQVITF